MQLFASSQRHTNRLRYDIAFLMEAYQTYDSGQTSYYYLNIITIIKDYSRGVDRAECENN